jgi:hypothetical protein
MSERIVQLTEDFAYRDDCSRGWTLMEGPNGWVYVCQKHQRCFAMNTECDGNVIHHRAGETVTIPSTFAEQLVRAERAVYPTHQPDPDDSVVGTLNRVNAMLEAEGLPLMDAEGMGVVSIQGRQSNPYGRPRRPARPRDRNLANSLGLDPADIADMRKLAKGEDPA